MNEINFKLIPTLIAIVASSSLLLGASINFPPDVEFTVSVNAASRSVSLNSFSKDVDGKIGTIVWDLGDGEIVSKSISTGADGTGDASDGGASGATGATVEDGGTNGNTRISSNGDIVSHTYLFSGTYKVKLTVIDDDGAITEDSKIVVIPSVDPVVAFNYEIINPNERSVKFESNATAFENNRIISWFWEFDDITLETNSSELNVPTSSIEHPIHVYSKPGTYNVKLTTTDDHNNTSEKIQEVVLSDFENGNYLFINKGWTLIGTPFKGRASTLAEVSSILGTGYVIWVYNGGVWANNISGDANYNPEFILNSDQGLWVNSKNSGFIELANDLPTREGDLSISSEFSLRTIPVSYTFPIINLINSNQDLVLYTYSQNQWTLYDINTIEKANRDILNKSSGFWIKGDTNRSVSIDSALIDQTISPQVTIRTNIVDFNTRSVNLISDVSDLDSDTFSFSWNLGDGTSFIESSAVLHTYSAFDIDYNVSLTVTDDQKNRVVTYATINIPTSQAFAQGDINSTVVGLDSTRLQFDFDQTANNGGSVTTYLWDFGDNNNSAAETSLKNPIHKFSSDGSYNVRVTTTNSSGNSNSHHKLITISNSAPIARFSNQSSGLNVKFDASASSDDGGTLLYGWSFGDEPTDVLGFEDAYHSADANTSHVYASSGHYKITLFVQDIDRNIQSFGKELDLNNSAPTISFVNTVNNAIAGELNFVASASDLDGTVAQGDILWDFGDPTSNSNIVAGVNVNHIFTRYGSYTITAQATDNSGAFTLNKRIVRVAPDSAPILDVNTSVLVSDEGRVQFEVTRLDMEGTSANYSWSFNDAGSSTSSSVNPIFNYTTSGTYTPSLTVTDNLGNSKTITKSVVITLGGSYKNIIFDVPSADSDVISFDDNTTQSITVTSFIKDSNSSSPFVNEGVTIVELQSADWLSYSGEDGNNVASGNSATSNNFGIFDLNLSSTTNNTGATRSAKIMFVLNSDSTKNKTFTITQPK